MTPDPRVRLAAEHWAPRMMANGVDPNDCRELIDGLDRWEDWCAAWTERARSREALAEEAARSGLWETAGALFLQASLLYHFGKFLFFEDEAAYRQGHAGTVRAYRRALPLDAWPGEVVRVPFPGGALTGVFRRPWHVARPPVVVLVPGLDSVKEELHAYGNELLRRGLAVLAVDGPGQGESEADHPLRPDYEVAVGAVLDTLAERPDVDGTRVGVFGVSLGGYFAARAVALEPRLRAGVAVSPAFRVQDAFDGAPPLTRAAFARRLRVPDETAARATLAAFTLEDALPHLSSPLLVVAGGRDRIFPPSEAEAIARRAGDLCTLWLVPDGNHVVNNRPYRYRPQAADWLRATLAAAP